MIKATTAETRFGNPTPRVAETSCRNVKCDRITKSWVRKSNERRTTLASSNLMFRLLRMSPVLQLKIICSGKRNFNRNKCSMHLN